MTNQLITLDDLALEIAAGAQSAAKAPVTAPAKPGGDKIGTFLNSPSGEGNLSCEQALAAHCSAKCTNGALDLLKGLQKKGK